MKKNLPLLNIFLLFSFGLVGQISQCGHDGLKKHLINSFENYETLTKSTFDKCLEKVMRSDHDFQANVRSTYEVKMVFHVVYNTDAQNIPDSTILAQIDQINADFNRWNDDAVNTRDIYKPIAGSFNINFVLADFDPDGNPTSGINRIQTDVPTFYDSLLSGSWDDMKFDSTGGYNSWDTERYINVWICNLGLVGSQITIPLIIGFAPLPVDPTMIDSSQLEAYEYFKLTDGIVIDYQVIGPKNPNSNIILDEIYTKGRTLTHEMGHYFGLPHIWGEEGCSINDGLEDTPPMARATSSNGGLGSTTGGCPPGYDTLDTCTDDIFPDMWENYMDYSDQECQNMFTKDQTDLMEMMLNEIRSQLTQEITSSSFIYENNIADVQFFYPNPVSASFSIKEEFHNHEGIEVFDSQGQLIKISSDDKMNISTMSAGLYLIRLRIKDKVYINKLMKL